jgi:hypothetical protein
MYKRREDSTIVGVLIDFDLAVLRGSQSTNTERTGTMIFMALDMPTSIAADTYQLHLYRYDVESFLWVAIWICGSYEGGKERQDASFKDWTQGDARHCHVYKFGSLRFSREILWSKGHQAREKHLRRMILHLDIDHANRRAQRRAQRREQELAILDAQEAGGVVKPEVPESPESPEPDYNWIDSKLFHTLREELCDFQK